MAQFEDAKVLHAEVEDPSFPHNQAVSTQGDPVIFYIFVLFIFGVGLNIIFEKINWKRFGKV